MKFQSHGKEDNIDWGKNQLLVSNQGHFVLSDGTHEGDVFSGTILNTITAFGYGHCNAGDYLTKWPKKQFKVYPYAVTLEKD